VIRREPIQGTDFNYDIGWWYGALVSDGWASKTTVGYAKVEEAKRQTFERIAREQLSKNFKTCVYREKCGEHKLGDSCKIHLNGVDLVHEVFNCVDVSYDGVGRRALFKKVPDEIINNGSRECLLGFVAGMFDGDGSLSLNMVTGNPRMHMVISTSSPFLVEGMKTVFRRLGVRSTAITHAPRGHSNTSYTITPSLVDLFPLLPELYMVGAREAEMLERFKALPAPYDQCDPVPIAKGLAHAVRRAIPMGKAATQEHRSVYMQFSRATQTGTISRSWLRIKVAEGKIPDVPGWSDYLDWVMNDDVYWAKVEKVEDAGKREVFDLEVPATKVFAVNGGVVIYDTMSIHVPVADAAVKEAYERMLPSKHLRNVARFDVHYLPTQEFLLGLYQATRKAKADGKVHRFASKDDVRRAYRRGEIGLTDQVVIGA
jgi:hypothetical protein